MRLSQEKRDRIKESILAFLFHNSPSSYFTSQIAAETARDEEFTKDLLYELEKKGLITSVKKNSKGKDYERRIRWRISPRIYETYKTLQQKGIEAY